ncbi:MAG: NYN domain-containing protein, partial [Candidatus Paceibacterota bacterium]
LRRFYYGSDYGQKDSSNTLLSWSETVLTKAEFNHLNIVTKRVKYIHSDRLDGFQKKCDLDVEMTVDLIRLREEYDNIILFSGDGDLFYVLKYLREEFKKSSYVFSARNHIGKELMDGVKEGILEKIVYIDDFKYRLDADRFKYR